MTSGAREPRRGGMVKNFFHLGVGQVVTTVLTIVLSGVMARVLSPDDYGLMVLLMSIASFTFVVVDWGHGTLIIREAARYPDSTGELIGSALAIRTLVTLLACPLVMILAWLLGYDLRTRILAGAMVIALLPQYLGLSFGWAYRAHERMDRDALLNIQLKFVVLLLSVLCFVLGGRLVALLPVWFVAGSLTLATGLVIYRKLGLPPLAASRGTVARLLRDGTPIFMMTVAGALEHVVNANILYKLASPTVVGWFGAAWTIAGTLLAPGTVLCMAAYPRLSMAAGNPVAFKETFDATFRPVLLLAVLGATGMYVFADLPVVLIYGEEKFGPAADILRAFAPVLLLVYLDLYLSTAIVAAGRATPIAWAKAASVVLNTSLVFVLVPLYDRWYGNGGIGVMYALAGGEVLMFLSCVWLLRRTVDLRTADELFRTLVAGAATVAIFLLAPRMNPVLGIPLCIAAFAALAMLFGALKRSDVTMLLGAFRKSPPADTP